MFVYSSNLMAQALSVVAEAGIDGMHYNGLVEAWAHVPSRRKSSRMRWSLIPADLSVRCNQMIGFSTL